MNDIKTATRPMTVAALTELIDAGGVQEVIGYDVETRTWVQERVTEVELLSGKVPCRKIGLHTGRNVVLPKQVSVLLHSGEWCMVADLPFNAKLQAFCPLTTDTYVKTSWVVDAPEEEYTNIAVANCGCFALAEGLVVQSLEM